MALSWRIWRALRNPPRQHPLFRQVLAKTEAINPRPTGAFFTWMFMCTTLTFFWTTIFQWVLVFLLLLLLGFNTLYGLRIAWSISGTIGDEKERQRYDLLAALPFGLFGTSWAISTGCLHRRWSFRWVPFVVQATCIVFLATLLFGNTMTYFFLKDDSLSTAVEAANIDLLKVGILMVPGVVVFYLDHLYSNVTAVLFGIAAAAFARNGTEARLQAFPGFLSLQLIVYAVAYGLIAIWLPQVLNWLGFVEVEALLLLSLIGVVFFVILREGFVRWLWRHMVARLNETETEAQAFLHLALNKRRGDYVRFEQPFSA